LSGTSSGDLSLEGLFNTTLKPIEGTRPQQYRSQFDRYSLTKTASIPRSPAEGDNPALVYAIATTIAGLILWPTHNKRLLLRHPASDWQIISRTTSVFAGTPTTPV